MMTVVRPGPEADVRLPDAELSGVKSKVRPPSP